MTNRSGTFEIGGHVRKNSQLDNHTPGLILQPIPSYQNDTLNFRSGSLSREMSPQNYNYKKRFSINSGPAPPKSPVTLNEGELDQTCYQEAILQELQAEDASFMN